jgi:hypothetical protein
MKSRYQTDAHLSDANAGALCECPVFGRSLTAHPRGAESIHISYLLVFIALSCLLCSVPAHASGEFRTAEIESLRITYDAEWCDQTAPGYWPVRFDITNFGNDRVIELRGIGTRFGGMSGYFSFEIHQSIPLKRSDHVKLTIPVPVFAENENLSFQILERGKLLQHFGGGGLQSRKPSNEAGALIVADPATPFGAMASGLIRPVATAAALPPGVHPPNLDFVLDPLRLPSNWLGLTSVRAVFIGAKELEKLAEPQKEALLAWTASGGDLIYVDGDLSTLFPDPQTRPVSLTQSESNHAAYYFGRIQLIKSSELRATGLENALFQTYTAGRNGELALPANRSSDWLKFSGNGFRLPISGMGGLPVRSYLTILVVFSLLIGPVNYLWLWRKRRQILLVFTVPLISAVFIVLLSGYAIFGEGFDITVRAESFTLLDQKTNHAATRATVSMYAAGMAPSNGLRFSRDVAVYPIIPNSNPGSGSGERQLLDLTELQQFSSGLVKARTPSNFEEISFRPARERLSFNYADGAITVVNGLGTTITRLFYRDAGKFFMLDLPLRAGGKALMRSTDQSSLFGVLPSKFHFYQELQAERSYIAWLESSPFLDIGAPKVKERDSLHLVLGYVGEEK